MLILAPSVAGQSNSDWYPETASLANSLETLQGLGFFYRIFPAGQIDVGGILSGGKPNNVCLNYHYFGNVNYGNVNFGNVNFGNVNFGNVNSSNSAFVALRVLMSIQAVAL